GVRVFELVLLTPMRLLPSRASSFGSHCSLFTSKKKTNTNNRRQTRYWQTRRSVLVTACGGTPGPAADSATVRGWEAAAREAKDPPAEGRVVSVTVNGQGRTFDGDPSMPLMWYLRDELGLTGTKFGCGVALCGACTVHLNGEAIRSCSIPMSD